MISLSLQVIQNVSVPKFALLSLDSATSPHKLIVFIVFPLNKDFVCQFCTAGKNNWPCSYLTLCSQKPWLPWDQFCAGRRRTTLQKTLWFYNSMRRDSYSSGMQISFNSIMQLTESKYYPSAENPPQYNQSQESPQKWLSKEVKLP